MADPVSVVVTTYNREDALDAVLRSLAGQTDRDFEVVVADDGSREATAELVRRWQTRIGVRLKHAWHPHDGFRAGEIRNRAVLMSTGRYCIFLDGDCLAPPDFVSAHRSLAEPGWFVAGNRALLSRELTDEVLAKNKAAELWGLGSWASQWMRGGVNRLLPLLRVPAGPLRKFRPQAWEGARSCNLAVWRSDFDRVDGFDATFNGWGREDTDLLIRLIRSGVSRKDGVCATGVIHLWHPEADRSYLPENDQRLDRVIASEHIRAERGMSCLTTAGR